MAPLSRFFPPFLSLLLLPACGDSGEAPPSSFAGQSNQPPGGSGASTGNPGDPPGSPSPGEGPAPQLPTTCASAAAAYSIQTKPLPGSRTASLSPSSLQTRYATALSPEGETVYVGFTQGGTSYLLTEEEELLTLPSRHLGSITGTPEGVALLLFDPNTEVGARTWARVEQYSTSGALLSETDLFRSADLSVENSKGAPETSRMAYLEKSNELIVYFGHTQRYSDGVRHQGGYLASLNPEGALQLLSGWYGSHNLDQRLLSDGERAWLLGRGDAYPEGIFFGQAGPRPATNVLLEVAVAGNGAVNAHLGGLVDLGENLAIPFLTQRSLPADLDAGTWPNIDEEVANQIRQAERNPTDIGLLLHKKTATPGLLEPIWLDIAPEDGHRFLRLKSAPYGSSGLILLAWAEAKQTERFWEEDISGYYTLVVDPSGAICQPKTQLGAGLSFAAGDDLLVHPSGAILWAQDQEGQVQLVALTPRSQE